jgi:hypothetical protein
MMLRDLRGPFAAGPIDFTRYTLSGSALAYKLRGFMEGPMKRAFRESATMAALCAVVSGLVIFYHLSGLAVWVAGFVPLD